MKKAQGMVYVFEGDGKGKTSAALGVALRMLLLEKQVEWVAWYKQDKWKTAEMNLERVFPLNLRMHWNGKGFFGGPMDTQTVKEHKRAAQETLLFIKEEIFEKRKPERLPDLLVMDEVLRAVNDGLVKSSEVLNVVKGRGKTHVVMTGDTCPVEISKETDLITRMVKVKHPFDKGVLAVSGLDF